jgi:hypothetical protein
MFYKGVSDPVLAHQRNSSSLWLKFLSLFMTQKLFFFKTKTKKGSKLARLSNNLPDSHHDGEKIKGKD